MAESDDRRNLRRCVMTEATLKRHCASTVTTTRRGSTSGQRSPWCNVDLDEQEHFDRPRLAEQAEERWNCVDGLRLYSRALGPREAAATGPAPGSCCSMAWGCPAVTRSPCCSAIHPISGVRPRASRHWSQPSSTGTTRPCRTCRRAPQLGACRRAATAGIAGAFCGLRGRPPFHPAIPRLRGLRNHGQPCPRPNPATLVATSRTLGARRLP